MDDKYMITVSFQGVALKDHSIDVNQLAPAMLALGKLFDDANAILNKGHTTTTTKVVATSEGSFDISFLLNQSFIQGVKDMFAASAIPASQIAQVLFFNIEFSLSLSGLLKWLKGKLPKNIKEDKEGVHFTNVDNSTITVNYNVYNLYNDSRILNNFKRIAQPVNVEGIDELRFIGGKNQKEIITKEDYDYYALEDIDEEIISDEILNNQVLDILHASKINYKWYLKHGAESNYYTITDPEFLAEQKSGQRISVEKDMLKSNIRYLQKKNKRTGKITIEREIVKAEIIYNYDEQLKLDYPKKEEKDET